MAYKFKKKMFAVIGGVLFPLVAVVLVILSPLIAVALLVTFLVDLLGTDNWSTCTVEIVREIVADSSNEDFSDAMLEGMRITRKDFLYLLDVVIEHNTNADDFRREIYVEWTDSYEISLIDDVSSFGSGSRIEKKRNLVDSLSKLGLSDKEIDEIWQSLVNTMIPVTVSDWRYYAVWNPYVKNYPLDWQLLFILCEYCVKTNLLQDDTAMIDRNCIDYIYESICPVYEYVDPCLFDPDHDVMYSSDELASLQCVYIQESNYTDSEGIVHTVREYYPYVGIKKVDSIYFTDYYSVDLLNCSCEVSYTTNYLKRFFRVGRMCSPRFDFDEYMQCLIELPGYLEPYQSMCYYYTESVY